MGGVVTEYFRLHNARQLYESIGEASPDVYYLFIGRTLPHTDDTTGNAPTPKNSVTETTYDPWPSMIAMKRVNESDERFLTRRIDWANNTLFDEYSDTTENLDDKNFYVLQNDDDYVYKVIDNNSGANSTVKPTGTSTDIISTSDGYRWKYMFSLSGADKARFASPSFLPIKKIDSDDGSNQYSVQTAASNGAINHIKVTANGSGYFAHSGNVVAANSSSVTLASDAAANDAFYVDSAIYFNAGKGLGEIRRVIRYNGSTKVATVNGAYTTATIANTQTQYVVSPRVVIKGDAGQTTASRVTAYVSNTAGGQIRKINIISPGLNYGRANVAIVANTTYGSGATARAVISPPGGHGSEAWKELYAKNVVLNAQLVGPEGNTLPTNNDFRSVGIISNPLLRNGQAANASIIDQCFRLTLTNVSGDFTADELITSSEGADATGRVVRFSNTNASRTEGILRMTDVKSKGTGLMFT
ncbi:MAG: hypothetical protein VW270_19675, partial [Candidatus Poseidoniales archaeon]